LVYVWAVEQDELSKRKVPQDLNSDDNSRAGQDVFVPWTLSTSSSDPKQRKTASKNTVPQTTSHPHIFNRYYHMFAKGELTMLVLGAARELGIGVGSSQDTDSHYASGVEIVQDGWERSNYYVELRCWSNK